MVICNIFLIFVDYSNIKLYRWVDGEIGIRKIPDMNKPLSGKALITPGAVFEVNLDTKECKLKENGKVYDFGSALAYEYTDL